MFRALVNQTNQANQANQATAFLVKGFIVFQLLSRSTSEEANTRCCGEVF